MNEIKTHIKLYFLVFVMSSFIIGIGFFGIWEIKKTNQTIQTLYADRLLPMDQLADVRFYYAVGILSTAQQVNEQQLSFSEARKKIQQAQDSINTNWKTYKLTSLKQEEKQLVKQTAMLMSRSDKIVEKLKLILKEEDPHALDNIVNNELFPAVNPVLLKITDLLNLQVKVGKNTSIDNLELYGVSSKLLSLLIIIALVFGIPFSYYLVKKIKSIVSSFNVSTEKLATVELNYSYLIKHAGEAILILNDNTLIIDSNDRACQLLGYSHEELLQMKIIDLIPPSELEKQIEDIESVRKNKGLLIYRKLKRKDGTELDAEINNRLMEGKGFFAILRDITERKKAELALKESEKKYRYLFDNNPAYIIIWDLENLDVLEVNNAVFEKYGYGKEEWMNMSVTQIRPEEDHQKIKDFAKLMLDSDEPIQKRTWRHIKKNGQEMLMDISSHRIDYNNRQAILSLGRDVTEQVKVERELAEREAQLNLFIEHSPASLAMFDNEMRYIATSRRWMSDYNLGEQNIIGKNHYEVFSDISQDWKAIHKRCLEGAVEKKDEDLFVRSDGSIQWLKWEIHPWHKGTGEIGGIIMFTEIITERKLATERFKVQFENAPDIILYVNKELKIETINRNSPTMTKEELVGMDCILILPEESRQIAREAINKCFETGKPQEIESALSHNRWVRSRFVAIANNGEVDHVIVFSTDMTEQKKAEQKVLQSEERHRALTDNISDAILLVNENLKVEYQSLSAERITGYSAKEAKFKTILDFLHPDDLEKSKVFFNELYVSPGVPKQNQFRIINKKGHIVWIEGTIQNLLHKEGIHAFIINCRDVSNRKKLEEEQALTASIVKSSEDAIISKTIDGHITSWNKGAEKILGYSPFEVIGKHISILVPLNLRGEEKRILEEVRKGHSVDHYETQRLRKDGEIIYVSLTISPIKDVLGNVVGASKIMRDITENKKVEAELIRFNADLKKTNAELDRFVYSVSHDLRAPLKSMLGLICITKDGIDTENVELYERLTMLDDSVIKLDNFIENILNYSKNSRMELDREEINFEKLIREIKESHEFMDITKELNFQVEINSKGKFVSDNNRLNVVLNNLVSNAIKYRDTSKETSFVNISISYNNTNATIIIEDNGIGIANKYKQKVFDMFYRGTSLSSGSGLGLYIVKETIEKLGGKINVESELNKGTKFIIEIANQVNILN